MTTTQTMAEKHPVTTAPKYEVKKAKGRRNSVSNVDLGRLDAPRLRRVLRDHCKLPKAQLDAASDEQCTVIAATWFEREVAEADQGTCLECGGSSGGDLPDDACPYCGDGAELPAAAPEPAPATAKKSKKAAAPPALGAKVAEDAPRGASGQIIEVEEVVITTTLHAVVPETIEQEAAMTQMNGTSAVLVQTDKNKKKTTELVTCKVLDVKVADVRRFQRESKVSVWKLGGAVREIYEQKLWSLRPGEGGKGQAWRSFESFCNGELGVNPQQALKWVDINKAYSEDQVAEYGVSKLSYVLQAPPEARPALLDTVKTSTKREIEKAVKAARKDTGYTKPPRDGVDKKPTKGGAVIAKKGEKITVASLLGKNTVKLYKKPSERIFVLKDLPRAKRLADAPFGQLELENGVVLEVTVQQSASGELVAAINFKRIAE